MRRGSKVLGGLVVAAGLFAAGAGTYAWLGVHATAGDVGYPRAGDVVTTPSGARVTLTKDLSDYSSTEAHAAGFDAFSEGTTSPVTVTQFSTR